MIIDPLLAEPLALFVLETESYARTATECVLALERSDGDLVKRHQQLARVLHTLKGTAATFGLTGLAEAAHRMETAVAPAAEVKGPLPAPLADALLRCFDGFVATLRACVAGRAEPEFPRTLITAFTARPGERAGANASASAPADTGAPPAADPAAPAMTAAQAAALAPPPWPLEPELEVAPEVASWPVRASDVAAFTREVEHLRDLHLRLEARARELARALAGAELMLAAPLLRPLRAQLAEVERGLTSDAQETAEVIAALEQDVKQICTLPVRTVLDPLHRAVRDLCRTSGRRARLSVVGGEEVLDRRLLDALRGPLVQLVRNAVDHGIEPPAVRLAANKDPEAQIVITVERRGNLVFVEVADDGAGIDRAALGAAAVARRVVTREVLSTLSASEIDWLVFQPGLSTRSEITEVSGRGVGLDVVLEEVRGHDGWIDVHTTPGQGTRFSIHMPMEIGSSWLLVVTAAGGSYGIPLAAVEGVVVARADAMRIGRRHMSLVHHEALLPIVDLGWLLGLRERKAPALGQSLLIIQAEGRRVALAVDEVTGEQDLVVRALPAELRHLPPWQGAATLARGDFLLVARPEWLATQNEHAEQVVTRRILVVDDSLTARALHRSVLESGGYTVHGVASAEQALAQLADTTYDLVISDLVMAPGALDGIELLARIRGTPSLAQLPVILVSVSDDREARARAQGLGVDAYLTKKECASGRLLGVVSAVLSRRRAS